LLLYTFFILRLSRFQESSRSGRLPSSDRQDGAAAAKMAVPKRISFVIATRRVSVMFP